MVLLNPPIEVALGPQIDAFAGDPALGKFSFAPDVGHRSDGIGPARTNPAQSTRERHRERADVIGPETDR